MIVSRVQFDTVTLLEFNRVFQPMYLTVNRETNDSEYPLLRAENELCIRGPDFFEPYFAEHSYFMNRIYREDE